MKKKIISIGLLLMSAVSFGQTIAPDFSATDCNGDPHTLYSELDNGKTIIVIWVMPCIGCVNATLEADSTRDALSVTYPNNVLLWIVDDGPPSDCSTLSSWIPSIGMQPQRTFGNYSNEINQDNYGGFGMPHMMVVGANKQIYYNELNTSGDGLYQAVENAINLTTSVAELKKTVKFALSPNPAKGDITIESETGISTISFLNITGQVIKTFNENGARTMVINTDDIPVGSYLVRITDVTGVVGMQKLIITN